MFGFDFLNYPQQAASPDPNAFSGLTGGPPQVVASAPFGFGWNPFQQSQEAPAWPPAQFGQAPAAGAVGALQSSGMPASNSPASQSGGPPSFLERQFGAAPEWLSNVSDRIGENSYALLGFGSGLLSAPGPEGFAKAFQGFAQGAQYDTKVKETAAKKAELEKSKKALIDAGMDKEVVDALGLEEARDLQSKLFFERLKGRDPTELARNAEAAGYTPGTAEYQSFIKQQLAPKATENDREVSRLQERGYDRNMAEDIAYGRVRMGVNPVTQQPEWQNVTQAFPPGGGGGGGGAQQQQGNVGGGNAGVPAIANRIAGGRAAPAEKAQERGLYEMAAEPGVAGVEGSLREGWTKVAPQIPFAGFKGYPEQTETRARFEAAQGQFLKSMAENAKLPVYEMQKLREEVGIGPDVWTSSEAQQAKMRAVAKALRIRRENDRATAADTSMPVEDRKAALTRVRSIENFLGQLGVPEDGAAAAKPAAAKAPPKVGTIVKGHRFKGGDPADRNSWERVP